ncbi:sorbosone dehydrogenase family protein [Haloarchaeobius sp. FL176]|uniref:PQQ-dependent sugar dehydrogenase n=1 Tax=Haloarchaeobius sp. FL176 TaxID=2967129 RepID=UPI0026E56402|nr:PQQ-dependent sugar dehydrogenase [Haloarchaeobius sp. FL176]
MDRRRFLAATVGALTVSAGCASNSSDSDGTGTDRSPTSSGDGTSPNGTSAGPAVPDAVALETLATGLQNPLDIAFVPGTDRRYVAEQPGRVRVVDTDGVRDEPLLDLTDAVVTGFEQGLLGIALHPNFAENRRLFVRYSAPRRSDTSADYSHTFVLSAFTVSADGLTARRASERVVVEIDQPQANHNAGSVLFGPDGYLYLGVGDGGAANDAGFGHVDDWYDGTDGGNGQDVTENLLGSILRIDVDGREGDRGYAIPDDNPLVGREGMDEHYAWGFRNPWRLAFDGETLFAGDVGQNRFEEVDVVERGGNYGWNVREATHCFQADDCPDRTPDDVRGGEPLLPPVVEYPQEGAPVSGVSVIPGNVYRGDAIPGLQGQFVFGDYQAEGRLFVARPGENGLWETSVLPITDSDAGKLSQILSFGRHEGELYVLGNGGSGGGLHRLVSAA